MCRSRRPQPPPEPVPEVSHPPEWAAKVSEISGYEIHKGLSELAAAVRSAATPPSQYGVPAGVVDRIRDGAAWSYETHGIAPGRELRELMRFEIARNGDRLALRFYDVASETLMWTLCLDAVR